MKTIVKNVSEKSIKGWNQILDHPALFSKSFFYWGMNLTEPFGQNSYPPSKRGPWVICKSADMASISSKAGGDIMNYPSFIRFNT